MKSILVLYVPVLHKGYLTLFKKHAKRIEQAYLFDERLVGELAPRGKEIRAIASKEMRDIIAALGFFKSVEVLTHAKAQQLAHMERSVVTADEGISRAFVEKYMPDARVTYSPVFLRWDEKHVHKQQPAHYARISRTKFDREIMAHARTVSGKSSDWWRQVGAIAVKDKRIILETHNLHVPSEHMPYAFGDIRDHVPAGTLSHISTALHAEQGIIAAAARREDVGLEGADIYTTIFPCPVCAKMIAHAGIKRCFFAEGHSTFDGEQVLKAHGVEIVLVK